MTKKIEGWDDPTEDLTHDILTPEQVKAAKEKARANLEKERVKKATDALVEQETRRLQREEGLYIGGVADELVNITIGLPEYAASIVVNGHPYWHGITYPVPRHVADSLREQMYRCWEYENREINGKSMKHFYAQKHMAELYTTKGGGKVIGRADV